MRLRQKYFKNLNLTGIGKRKQAALSRVLPLIPAPESLAPYRPASASALPLLEKHPFENRVDVSKLQFRVHDCTDFLAGEYAWDIRILQ